MERFGDVKAIPDVKALVISKSAGEYLFRVVFSVPEVFGTMKNQEIESYLRIIRKKVANKKAKDAVHFLIDFIQADLREQLMTVRSAVRASEEGIKAEVLSSLYFLLKKRRDELGLDKKFCGKCGTFVSQIIKEEPTNKTYQSDGKPRRIVDQTLACECRNYQRTRPMPEIISITNESDKDIRIEAQHLADWLSGWIDYHIHPTISDIPQKLRKFVLWELRIFVVCNFNMEDGHIDYLTVRQVVADLIKEYPNSGIFLNEFIFCLEKTRDRMLAREHVEDIFYV